MIETVKKILNSTRFWMITAAAGFQIAKIYAPSLQPLWDILSVWLAGVVTIGTVDKAASAGSFTVKKATVEGLESKPSSGVE